MRDLGRKQSGTTGLVNNKSGRDLDILAEARRQFACPLAVYQVSGEYSMIKAAAEKGWIDERQVALESLIAMRRAGADLILTYFAPQVAGWAGRAATVACASVALAASTRRIAVTSTAASASCQLS